MIIAKLMGGLGNQMFQYAFGNELASRNHTILKLDTLFLLDRSIQNTKFVFRNYDLSIFNISKEFATPNEVAGLSKRTGIRFAEKVLNKILGTKKSYIREPSYRFHPAFLNAPDNTYLEGYWQSEKYFSATSDSLRKTDFTFREPLLDNSQVLLKRIKETNSVCVHVRRGDFVLNSFHETIAPSYYTDAERVLRSQVTDPYFFVFSDEIEWCRNNLSFTGNVCFVSDQYTGPKCQDYIRLMSACNHFIISNSSFAWWAVWLSNQKNNLVIAPLKWINGPEHRMADLIPKDWIRL